MLTYSVILLILLILIVFLGSALMKKRLAGRLEQALRKKDYDAYRKVIYARSATVFLNPNTILLLRASDQMASGNRDAAKKILPAIRVMRLEAAQKLAYLQLVQLGGGGDRRCFFVSGYSERAGSNSGPFAAGHDCGLTGRK